MKKLPGAILAIFFLISIGSASVSEVDFEELPTAWETGEELDFQMESSGSGLDRAYFQSRSPGEPGFTDRDNKICTIYTSCDWSFQHTEDETRTFEYRFWVESIDGDEEDSDTQQVTYFNSIDYSVEWTNRPQETSSQGSQVSMSATAHDSAGRFDTEGELSLQYRQDGDWVSFDTRSCSNSDSSDTCSNQGSTTLDSEKIEDGNARFRGKVLFRGGVTATTSIASTSIGEQGNVDTVDINDLPEEAEDGSSFEIQGDADGENLQMIYIQQREPGESGWTDWRSRSCSGDTCEINHDYNVDGTGEKEFRVYAEASGDSGGSDPEYVDFVEQQLSERVESVVLDELPDSETTNSEVDVTGSAEGENLEEIVLKTKERYEDWQEVTSDDCSGDSCDFDYNFETSETGELSFKLVATAGSASRDSNIEVIDFYDEEEFSVEDVNLDDLPDEHPTGDAMDVTGYAEGENLETLTLQKRPDDDWEPVETENCGESSSCEFDDTYQQEDAEEVEFRLKAKAGDDSENSNQETVDFQEQEEESSIESVSIDDLPDEHPVEEELEISGEADGESLDRIIIQERNPGDDWDEYRDRDCGNSDQCEISRDFSTGVEEEKEFRIKVEAGGDSDTSSAETVEFVDEEDDDQTGQGVDSVILDEITDRKQTSENIEVTGEAEGSDLEEIVLKTKERYESWEEITSEDCSGDECSFEYDFETSETGYLSFRLTAISDSDALDSNIEVVEFYEPEEFLVDSVSINNLPGTHPAGESLLIEGETSGENLETLELQKRESGGDWQTVETTDCFQSSSCEFDEGYQHPDEEEVDFRLRAEAGSSEGFSGVETVEFQEDDDSGGEEEETVDQVSIDNLPAEHLVGSSLQINGDASGENLDSITIQERNPGGSWSDQSTEECNDSSYCTISSSYNAGSSGQKDFRVRAEAGDESDVSAIETVDFRTETVINSLSIEELPDSELTGTTLEVSGSMTGENLDSLEIQRKYRYSGWNTLSSTACSGESCSLNTDYTEDQEGSTSFRLKGVAGTSEEFSGIETVEYSVQTSPEVTDVDLENIPSELDTGDELDLEAEGFGEELETLEISYRVNGGSWNTLESVTCSGESCVLDSVYSSSTEQSVDFRAKASAGSDTGYSEIRSTEFVAPEDPGPVVTELEAELEPTIGTREVGDSVLLEASGAGENLEELDIQARNSSDTTWSTLDTEDCGEQEECSFSHFYTAGNPGEVFFRSRVSNGTDTAVSSERSTVFFTESSVDSVSIDEITDEHPVEQELQISGDAEGENLEQIVLQVKEGRYGNWEVTESGDCEGAGSCSLESNYTRDSAGETSFRFYAMAGGDRVYSGIEVVDFQSEEEDQELQVSIGELPADHPTGESLNIEGWAEGEELEDIEIQSREEGEGWETINSSSCSGDYCSIDTSFTEENELTRDFSVRAFSEDDPDTSSIEVVVFEDEPDDGEDEEDAQVSDVEIEDLPEQYETDEELEIEAYADGRNLESLTIQERERYESWDEIFEEDCGGEDECEAETDFETSDEGEVEFRAVAEAGDETGYSGIEVVDFSDDSPEIDSNLWVNVEDDEGNDLEDARVRVRNGDSETGYTDRYGEVEFELEPDDYDVIASKPGYETEEKDVDIDEDDTRTVRFRLDRVDDFSVSIFHESEVCSGEDLEVEVEVSNFDDERRFDITGSGLGYETDTMNLDIDEDDTETVTIVFRDVEDIEDGDFTVRAEDTVTRSLLRTVDVKSCPDRTSLERNVVPQGLSARVSPGEVLTGERVRVYGDVQGVNRPVDVTVESEGFSRTVSSTRSGGYSIFFTPSEAGINEITVSSGGFSAERQVSVLPRATISRVSAPDTAVEGERIEVCGDIRSDVEAEVMLFQDGDKLDSKTGSGTVCFETEAASAGETRYRVQASTYGETGSAAKVVEVLEAGQEFDRFPGQVTVKKTEPGQAKIELYNQRGDVTRYSIGVEGIRESWFSQTAENVVLRPGERETVYMYFSPERSGEFNPEIVVGRNGEEAFRRELKISSHETDGREDFYGLLENLF